MTIEDWQKQKTALEKELLSLTDEYEKLLQKYLKAGNFPKSFTKIKLNMQKAQIKLQNHLGKDKKWVLTETVNPTIMKKNYLIKKGGLDFEF